MPEQICEVWSDIRQIAKREMRDEAVSDKSGTPPPIVSVTLNFYLAICIANAYMSFGC